MALLGGVGAALRAAAGRHPAGAPVRDSFGELSRISSACCSALVFIVIVYFVPQGVAGLCAIRLAGRCDRRRSRPCSAAPHPCSTSAVRKTFGGLVAVDDLDVYRSKRARSVGLIGPNGSGKTTMLNLISGAAALRHRRRSCFKGTPIARLAANRIARLGVGAHVSARPRAGRADVRGEHRRWRSPSAGRSCGARAAQASRRRIARARRPRRQGRASCRAAHLHRPEAA